MSRSRGREPVDDPVPDADLARRQGLEPGEQSERGGLPRPRRADEHHELAVRDLQREVAHRGDIAELLGDVVEHDPGHGQPFTAPVSMPRMNCRWKTMKTIRIGIATITAPAEVSATFVV